VAELPVEPEIVRETPVWVRFIDPLPPLKTVWIDCVEVAAAAKLASMNEPDALGLFASPE